MPVIVAVIVAIDRFILERIFTPPAHWCERRFGITNLQLARGFVHLGAGAMLLAGGILTWDEGVGLFLPLVFVAIILPGTMLLKALKVLDAYYDANPEALPPENLGSQGAGARMFLVVSALLLLNLSVHATYEPKDDLGAFYWWSYSFGYVLFVISFYLMSVRRPPPQREERQAPALLSAI